MINNSEIDRHLVMLENEDDYYEGTWEHSGLFANNICKYSLIKDLPCLLEIIEQLKSLNFIGASYNKFGPYCRVPVHNDSILINSNNIVRVFIPLEGGYDFDVNCKPYADPKSEIIKPSVAFYPQLDHDYKNNNNFSQYFMIADMQIGTLDSKFWSNYLSYAIEHYV